MGGLLSHHPDSDDENDTVRPPLQRIVQVNNQWEFSDMPGSAALTQGGFYIPHPLSQRASLITTAELGHSCSGLRQNGGFTPNPTAKAIPVDMLVSLDKGSLALQWVAENAAGGPASTSVSLQFECSAKISDCRAIVYFNAKETQCPNGLLRYTSETPCVIVPLAAGQRKHACPVPDALASADGNWDWLHYESSAENTAPKIPIVIVLVTPDGLQEHHSHAAVDKEKFCTPSECILPALCCVRQSICHQGQIFRLHELYGLATDAVSPQRANANATRTEEPQAGMIRTSGADEETGNKFLECIVCFEKSRAVALWPCRHACFCRECAGYFQIASNRCPICRQEVTALLELAHDQRPSNP